MVECQIVTLVVTGSSPVIYPILKLKKINVITNTCAYNIYCVELKSFVNSNIINNKQFYKYVEKIIKN